MSLLLLLSLATGLTLGVLLVGRRVSGWLIAAFVIGAVIACFALFISAIDPDITDKNGSPVLNRLSWLALCGLLFSLSLGIGTLLASIVVQLPKPTSKGRRS